jgi:hypothetical protein
MRFTGAFALALLLFACGDDDGGGAPGDGPGNADAAVQPDGSAAPDAAVTLGEPIYPADRTQSPLTDEIREGLRAVAARDLGLTNDVFAKIGDSHTVSQAFLACLDGPSVDLAGRTELEPTRAWFAAGNAAGSSPFDRISIAATGGWFASDVLAGDPTPLAAELEALTPRLAVLMFGTNDINGGNLDAYGGDLLDIADTLLALGIIPIYTTIPPRLDNASADAQVPLYNAVVRGVAQGRGFPLVDLHRELAPLGPSALAGDGIHLAADPGGACVFTAGALAFGHNVRNLITLEALHRMKTVIIDGGPVPDADAPRRRGAGTPDDPYLIDRFPFTDLRDTSSAGVAAIASYPGCAAPQDESGPEIYYRLEVATVTDLRIRIIDRNPVDVDLHLVGDPAHGESCRARDDRALDVTAEAGVYHLVVDTFVDAGGPNAGEYLLVITSP